MAEFARRTTSSALSAAAVRSESRLVALACTALVVVLAWAVAQGVAPELVLLAGVLPAFLAVGYRFGFALLVVVLLLRPLVDSAGIPGANAGIALGVVALGALVAVHDVRALILLGIAAPVLAAPALIGRTEYGAVALQEGLRLFSVVAVAAVTLVVPGQVSRARAARVIQLSALVPAGVALLQAATGTGTTIGAVSRSSGTLSQANPAAFYFAMAALCSLVLVVEGTRRRVDAVGVVFFSVAVMTTGSITGTLTLLVALFLYTALSVGLWSRTMLALVSGLALVVVVALLSPVGQGRIAEYTKPAGPEDQGNSLLWRYEAWSKILDVWRERPVTGYGFGATLPGGILATNIAHNEYVWMLAEMGIIGLVLVLTLVTTYLGFLRRFVAGGADRLGWALALTLVVSTALNATADNTLHFTPSLYLLAFLLATVWRCASQERTARRVPAPTVVTPHQRALRAREVAGAAV